MWTLALETTSQHPSLALLEDEACVEEVTLEPRSCAADLTTALQDLLQRHALALGDVGLLVAANGPGSFTGVRVGLATVKALTEAAGLSAVTVGTLEAVCAAADGPPPALAVMEAGRGEVYWRAGSSEGVESVAAMDQRLVALPGMAVTPDTSLHVHWPKLQLVGPALALTVARLGRSAWLAAPAGGDVLTMDARYLGGRWGQ